MERKIIGFGEIVYDIIFKNHRPIEARVGGSILNMMVSLRRFDIPVVFIADLVNDTIGREIYAFLQEEKITTDYIYWHNEGRSRIALAFLNEQNDAEYLFYKMQNHQLPLFNYPEILPTDILIFGSFYAIKPDLRPILEPFLHTCNEKDMILLYDPNFRKSHLNVLPVVKPFIEKNIGLSTITKGSIEDFELIFNTTDISTIVQRVRSLGCQHLIITRGAQSVLLFSKDKSYTYTVPSINPISTIGAGDAFMAGLAYGIYTLNISKENLLFIDEKNWENLLKLAIKCSVEVCLSYENYLPKEKISYIKGMI